MGSGVPGGMKDPGVLPGRSHVLCVCVSPGEQRQVQGLEDPGVLGKTHTQQQGENRAAVQFKGNPKSYEETEGRSVYREWRADGRSRAKGGSGFRGRREDHKARVRNGVRSQYCWSRQVQGVG